MSNITIIEREDKRVLTTEQLATVYETDVNNIKNNFNNHKEKFKEGKHYFFLQGEELREFKNQVNDIDLVGKRAASLYLWTERGANRHCKILDTDKAWEQFDNLEETYFRVKEQKVAVKQLSPELQAFKQIFDGMAKQELEQKRLQAEVVATKEEIAAVREVITINPKEEWRKETNKWISKICYKIQNYKTPKDKIYKALEERAKCKLSVRLKNLQGRAALNGMAQSQVDKFNNLDVIANDVRLKEIYISIVKEMAIKNGIKVKEVI